MLSVPKKRQTHSLGNCVVVANRLPFHLSDLMHSFHCAFGYLSSKLCGRIWSLCIFKSLLSLIYFDLKQWLSLAVVVNFDAWYLTFSHFWDDDFVFHAGWRGKMNDAFHCRCEKGGEEVWTLTILWLLRTLKSYGEDSWLLVCGGDKRGNFF